MIGQLSVTTDGRNIGGDTMRLIDGDALLKRKGCAYDSEGHLLFAVGTGDIVHAPTIDAIPVEWLEAHKMECIDDWGVVPISIGMALIMWQQEQEAR